MTFRTLCARAFLPMLLWGMIPAFPQDFQPLRDNQGNTMNAKVLSFDGATVVVQLADTRTFSVPIGQFCPQDRAMIQEKHAPTAKDGAKDAPPAQDSALKPGSILTLDFPDLAPMAGGQPSQCQIYLPTQYAPDKTFPLLVWFSGGKGSCDVAKAKNLVNPDRFIIVAMPYPNGKSVREAVNEGIVNDFWKYLKPMLEKVKETVPNISPKLRIAGGSSNGGHLTGTAISQKWRGFYDYFNAYILHEGGHAPADTYDAARGKPMLVIYGEKSDAYEWQKWFNEKIKASKAKITFIAMPDDGHGLSAQGRERIRQWTDALLEKKD